MPALVPIVAAVASVASIPIIGGITVGSLALTAALTAGSMIAQNQQQAAAKKASRRAAMRAAMEGGATSMGAVPASIIRQTARSAVAGRVTIYGRVRTGGQLVFMAPFQSTPSFLAVLLVVNQGWIDAIETTWIDGVEVSIRPDGYVTTYPFNIGGTMRVALFADHGSEAKSAAPPLLATAFPTQWTSAHKLNGLATVAYFANGSALTPELYQTVYRNGRPEMSFLVRGRQVYDPRDEDQDPDNALTWTFSDNAALCLADFLTRSNGYNLPKSVLDMDALAEAADICDEAVALKAGGTEARYRLSGAYDLTTEPKAAIDGMLDAMAGDLVEDPQTGLIRILPGAYRAPTVSFGADELLSCNLSMTVDPTVEFNTVKTTYVSPDHGWAEQEAEPWVETARVTALGVTINESLPLPWVFSHAQARRLAKLHAKRENAVWSGSIVTDFRGLLAIGHPTIALTAPLLGIEAETFEIVDMEVAEDFTTVTMQVRSTPEEIWNWNAASEEGTAPPVPPSTDDPAAAVPDPDLLAVEVDIGYYARFRWRVNRSGVDSASAVYAAEVQYRLASTAPGGAWTSGTPASAFSGASAAPLTAGQVYNWRVRTVAQDRGVYSDWVDGTNFTANVAATTPAAPTVTTTSAIGQVGVTVTIPDVLANPTLGGCRVQIEAADTSIAYNSTHDDMAGSTVTLAIGLAAGTYTVRAKTRTIGLVESAWSSDVPAESFAVSNPAAPGYLPPTFGGGAGGGSSGDGTSGSPPGGVDPPGAAEPPGGVTGGGLY